MRVVLEYLPSESLLFDPQNPRLPAHVDGGDSETLLGWMLEDAGLIELMRSIAVNGFFPAEPLLVTPASTDSRTPCIVLEGNRRLAAVKLLRDPGLAPRRKRAVADAAASIQNPESLRELPCVVFMHRAEVLDYLGYRHVTGVKQWEPAAKARYVDQLYAEYAAEVEGPEVYRRIARSIGSRADYVMRLLGSLRLHERLVDMGQEHSLSLAQEDVSFSLLTLALNYRAVTDFLTLEDLTQRSFEAVPDGELMQLGTWLYVPSAGDPHRSQLGDSRNMKLLAAALENNDGLRALQAGRPVEDAARATVEGAELLNVTLGQGATRLRQARGLLETTAPDEESRVLAREADDLAAEIDTVIVTRLTESATE